MAKKHVRRIIEVDGRRVVESKLYTRPLFPVGGTPPVEVRALSDERKAAIAAIVDVKPQFRPPHCPTYPVTRGAYNRTDQDWAILDSWLVARGYLSL